MDTLARFHYTRTGLPQEAGRLTEWQSGRLVQHDDTHYQYDKAGRLIRKQVVQPGYRPQVVAVPLGQSQPAAGGGYPERHPVLAMHSTGPITSLLLLFDTLSHFFDSRSDVYQRDYHRNHQIRMR
ncbi:hypothetical protein V6C40_17405 [Dickeya ananatis]